MYMTRGQNWVQLYTTCTLLLFGVHSVQLFHMSPHRHILQMASLKGPINTKLTISTAIWHLIVDKTVVNVGYNLENENNGENVKSVFYYSSVCMYLSFLYTSPKRSTTWLTAAHSRFQKGMASHSCPLFQKSLPMADYDWCVSQPALYHLCHLGLDHVSRIWKVCGQLVDVL